MRIADPGLFALKGAVRAAIVLPLALAIGLVVIDDHQLALFAAFGSISFLVFAEFGGSMKQRLVGYAGLALAGAGLIALGTALSESTAFGTLAMALVAFAVLFSGVVSGYVAAAQSPAILSFVLALMVPAGDGAIASRIGGWGLAAVLSVSAIVLLWPGRPRSVVRSGAARAAAALADLIEARGAAERERADAAARIAVRSARRNFVSLQHRPSGTGERTAALAGLIEDLGWLYRFAAADPAAAEVGSVFASERAEIEVEVPLTLRRCAAWLATGEPGQARLGELWRAHQALGRAALDDVRSRAGGDAEAERRAAVELDEVFRLRLLSFATVEIAQTTRRALGARAENPLELARERVDAAGRLARAHASMRSVWLRNSLRGALGLSLAVLIAQLADLQNAFWVVLGTMTVLRSSALATGATILPALLGTLAGIVVGGLLVVAVGGEKAALWALLPFATLLAAYSPRAVSFAAGQAGFSLVVLVLFNLLAPSGWEIGLVRIEDVAIGAGVSLLVGVLFWPRGADAVLRRALGDAYARASEHLDATVGSLLGGGPAPELEAREAFGAGQVLDVTIRDFLSDRSGAGAPVEDLTILLAGTTRVRQVADLLGHQGVLVRIGPVDPELGEVVRARQRLEQERDRVCAWYSRLGAALAAGEGVPAPDPRQTVPGQVVLERADGKEGLPPGVAISWAGRYLRALDDFEPPLSRAGAVFTGEAPPAG